MRQFFHGITTFMKKCVVFFVITEQVTAKSWKFLRAHEKSNERIKKQSKGKPIK